MEIETVRTVGEYAGILSPSRDSYHRLKSLLWTIISQYRTAGGFPHRGEFIRRASIIAPLLNPSDREMTTLSAESRRRWIEDADINLIDVCQQEFKIEDQKRLVWVWAPVLSDERMQQIADRLDNQELLPTWQLEEDLKSRLQQLEGGGEPCEEDDDLLERFKSADFFDDLALHRHLWQNQKATLTLIGGLLDCEASSTEEEQILTNLTKLGATYCCEEDSRARFVQGIQLVIRTWGGAEEAPDNPKWRRLEAVVSWRTFTQEEANQLQPLKVDLASHYFGVPKFDFRPRIAKVWAYLNG